MMDRLNQSKAFTSKEDTSRMNFINYLGNRNSIFMFYNDTEFITGSLALRHLHTIVEFSI